ncbi:MAG TPA: hypothetical protein VEY71_06100 [Chitinophagales bacterium]|nr:hypothetical protein [Chitinophagales bacterium]
MEKVVVLGDNFNLLDTESYKATVRFPTTKLTQKDADHLTGLFQDIFTHREEIYNHTYRSVSLGVVNSQAVAVLSYNIETSVHWKRIQDDTNSIINHLDNMLAPFDDSIDQKKAKSVK